ncbi:MAG: hypothetical protein JSU05_10205, partial [Bacteroidetes bacterium]|nr:hypothetical protein [Bacteroidota bacterium]
PFEQPFSSFLNSILYDHHFIKQEINKRTDSSFFFLRGYYTDFMPVDINPLQTEIRIAEMEFNHTDSLHTLDTMIVYQLLCITDSTDKGKEQVKKEFKKINRRYSESFSKNEYKYLNNADGKPVMELYNYYYSVYSISPVTVAWGRMPASKNYALTLTIRIKQSENLTGLVHPPDGF